MENYNGNLKVNLKVNLCPVCGKELKNKVIRHHIDSNMKFNNSERYKEYRNEDIILLCSQSCHMKFHKLDGHTGGAPIRIFLEDDSGKKYTLKEVSELLNIPVTNLCGRLSMARKRGQSTTSIHNIVFNVPPASRLDYGKHSHNPKVDWNREKRAFNLKIDSKQCVNV